MIIGFTGHRNITDSRKFLVQHTLMWLRSWKPEKAISGMAVGYDTLAARVCIYLNIPLVAAIPDKRQPNRWPKKEQELYYKILDRASEVVYVDEEPGYDGTESFIGKLFIRNKWIVDHSDKILAYYNNTETGGTANTILYAHTLMKLVIQIQHEAR